jgi:hypothetical protein
MAPTTAIALTLHRQAAGLLACFQKQQQIFGLFLDPEGQWRDEDPGHLLALLSQNSWGRECEPSQQGWTLG